MKRALTPVIATTLLLLLTVATSAAAYLFLNSFQSKIQSPQSQAGVTSITQEAGGRIKLISIESDKITIQNVGPSTISNIKILSDGNVIATYDSPISPNEIVSISIPYQTSEQHEIDIVGTGTQSIKYIVSEEEAQELWPPKIPTVGAITLTLDNEYGSVMNISVEVENPDSIYWCNFSVKYDETPKKWQLGYLHWNGSHAVIYDRIIDDEIEFNNNLTVICSNSQGDTSSNFTLLHTISNPSMNFPSGDSTTPPQPTITPSSPTSTDMINFSISYTSGAIYCYLNVTDTSNKHYIYTNFVEDGSTGNYYLNNQGPLPAGTYYATVTCQETPEKFSSSSSKKTFSVS